MPDEVKVIVLGAVVLGLTLLIARQLRKPPATVYVVRPSQPGVVVEGPPLYYRQFNDRFPFAHGPYHRLFPERPHWHH